MGRGHIVFLLCGVLAAVGGCTRKQAAPTAVTDDSRATLTASEIQIGDAAYEPLLLRGFYRSEGEWRWTAPKFAVSLAPPTSRENALLLLDFTLPVEVTRNLPAVTLTAKVNGVEVGKRRYTKPDRYQFAARVPAKLLRERSVEAEFEMYPSTTHPNGQDKIGIIAMAAALTPAGDSGFDREEEIRIARQGYQYLLAKRNLEILEILLGELGKNRRIDGIGDKTVRVFRQTD